MSFAAPEIVVITQQRFIVIQRILSRIRSDTGAVLNADLYEFYDVHHKITIHLQYHKIGV